MYYVKANNSSVVEFPYSIDDLKNDNPNTSFPVNVSNSTLEAWQVYPVEVSATPEVTADKKAVINDIPDYVNGTWVLGWQIQQKTNQEIQQLADEVREKRNSKLTACDWTQLSDASITDEFKIVWQNYRQALRDITSQSEFPINVVWPETP